MRFDGSLIKNLLPPIYHSVLKGNGVKIDN